MLTETSLILPTIHCNVIFMLASDIKYLISSLLCFLTQEETLAREEEIDMI